MNFGFKLRKLVQLVLTISIVSILIASFSSNGAKVQAQVSRSVAPIDYSLLSPALLQGSPAQLRLPQAVASENPLPVNQYFGTGSISYTRTEEVQGYQVYIQADPYICRQAVSCTEVYADAVAIDGLSPSIQEQYAMFFASGELNGYRTAGHSPYFHTLPNGQSVTILPWTEAGAGVGYEKGIWDECDERGICYRYVVGLKGGAPEALIAMLESLSNGTGNPLSGAAGWDRLINPADPRASF